MEWAVNAAKAQGGTSQISAGKAACQKPTLHLSKEHSVPGNAPHRSQTNHELLLPIRGVTLAAFVLSNIIRAQIPLHGSSAAATSFLSDWRTPARRGLSAGAVRRLHQHLSHRNGTGNDCPDMLGALLHVSGWLHIKSCLSGGLPSQSLKPQDRCSHMRAPQTQQG